MHSFSVDNRKAWFVVLVLMLVYVLSFVDRMILNLMVGPIKADLGISDTQISLLMGFSFALFYALCGVPLGRIADRTNRRNLITAGLLFWSLMTGLCGLARHYWQLFLCRIGVGVGEATLSPAAYSMISDLFPPERRATAISVYSMGIYLGMGLAFMLGGSLVTWASTHGEILLPFLGEVRPWQVVFLVLGLVGIIFGATLFRLREPKRQTAEATPPPVREIIQYLWDWRRAVFCHIFGFSMIAMVGYGSSSWIPTFFIRSHGWSVMDIGMAYGFILLVFGGAGIVLGGRLSDRLLSRGMLDAPMRVSAGVIFTSIFFGLGFLLTESDMLAISILALWTLIFSMSSGLGPAAVLCMVPDRMRGQATAIYLLIVNLIGLGFGPTAVALFTDYVFASEMALGYSLAVVMTGSAIFSIVILIPGLSAYRALVSHLNHK